MIEMKQLQYLVVCADLKSFSKAADVLYTTQPNVSKVIRSLEEELGFELFIRQNRGIRLTGRGRRVYEYACKAIDNVQQLAAFARMDKGEELLISCNPSSWMAACFTEFYNAHKEENVCFHIISASTEDVIRRCSAGKDDLGFVYMMEQQMLPFRYRLERGGLEFLELKRTKAILYLGHQHPLYEKSARGELAVEDISMEDVRLVQCYEDEFTLNRYWDIFNQQESPAPNVKVSVITNSDYVMQELLCNSDLANISGTYLSHEEKALKHSELSLYGEEEPVIFGCIRRKDEEPGDWARKYLDFAKQYLEREDDMMRGKSRI